MATTTKTTAKLDDGIPAILDRRTNGAGKPDVDALLAKIAELEAKVARKSTLVLKVSEKGAVSLYGLGRFPLTLYAEQWRKVLGMTAEIESFIADNADRLSTK
jgi:hypothetical protein